MYSSTSVSHLSGRPDEFACPNVVLEPRRLPAATVGPSSSLGAEFPGFSQPQRSLQPQLVPEATDPLEVHRPALADQHRVNPPVSVAWETTRQLLDLADQGRLVAALGLAVPQGRARPPQDSTHAPLGDVVLVAQGTRRGALLVGAHHVFLATSWSICLSSRSSATSLFSRSTSTSSWRHRRPVSTWAGS